MKKYLFSFVLLVALLISIFSILILISLGFTFLWFNGSSKLIVDHNGTEEYVLIQDAINDARDGDIIYVLNGVYCEHLYINKSIELKGADRDNTVIDGRSKLTGYITIVNITKHYVEGELVFQNTTTSLIGLYEKGNCIEIKADNVVVSNFTVQNSSEYGIYLNSSSECNLTHNNIINCHIGLNIEQEYDNSIDQSNLINGNPIYYAYNIHGTPSNPIIIENRSFGSIFLANCSYLVVQNTTVEKDGICLVNSCDILT